MSDRPTMELMGSVFPVVYMDCPETTGTTTVPGGLRFGDPGVIVIPRITAEDRRRLRSIGVRWD